MGPDREGGGHLNAQVTWKPGVGGGSAREGWREVSSPSSHCCHVPSTSAPRRLFFTVTFKLDIISRFRDKINCLNSNRIKGRAQTRIFVSQSKAQVKKRVATNKISPKVYRPCRRRNSVGIAKAWPQKQHTQQVTP